MSIDKLIPKKMRQAAAIAGACVALSATPAAAKLDDLYTALEGKGLTSIQDERTNINGDDVIADIYSDEFIDSTIVYPVVVIDSVLNQTEKDAVEGIGGLYLVPTGSQGEADSIYNVITGKQTSIKLTQGKLKFDLNKNSRVSIDIHSANGKKVRTLCDELKQKGTYGFNLNENMLDLQNGMYFLKLKTDNSTETRKFYLIK